MLIHRRCKAYLAILLLTLLVPFGCGQAGDSSDDGEGPASEPAISSMSGNLIDGSTLTVSGSGFGSHADFGGGDPYLNYIFEDCEAGVIDQASKNWSGWARMSDVSNRQGSSYNIFHERRTAAVEYTTAFGQVVTNDVRTSIRADVGGIAPVHNYFMSMWLRLSDDFGTISASSTNQVKLLMTTPDGTGGKDYFQTRGEATPPLRTETESGQLSLSHGPIDGYMPFGTWHRMDIWVSIPDATTGGVDRIKWWIDGKFIREAKQTDGHLQPDPADVNDLLYVSYIGYIKNITDASFSVQTDDHFLDFTMARVEISDDPVWDDTVQVHKEIQLPVSWTDTVISIEANLSAFSAGTPLYLYVINASGNVSDGYFIGVK